MMLIGQIAFSSDAGITKMFVRQSSREQKRSSSQAWQRFGLQTGLRGAARQLVEKADR